jgi:hypothetical protein
LIAQSKEFRDESEKSKDAMKLTAEQAALLAI